MRQTIHYWSYFATSRTWMAELVTSQVWRQHGCLSWLWRLQMAQSDRQVMSWFQCWQAVSSFLFVLCELQAKSKPLSFYILYLSHDHLKRVWLRVKCTLIGWFHPLCLLQSTAIFLSNSKSTNDQIGKHVLQVSRPTPCVEICAYAQMS